MKKILAAWMVLIVLITGISPVFASGTAISEDIVILYTNDVHTYIDGDLSYDVIAALKADLQTRYRHVLLADAGDHVQGTAYGSMDKGESIIGLMSAAGYDVATLGNHEFDYGLARCLELVGMAEYPYVSANFYHEKDGVRGDNVLDSYILFPCGDITLAVVGVTTPETFSKSTPAYFQDDEGNFIYGISGGDAGEDLIRDVQTAIDAAEDAGATHIVGLGHLGTDFSSTPWTSEEIIAGLSGLDAFIDGHSHSVTPGTAVKDKDGESVILTQTGEYFDRIGMMVIDADTGEITTELIESCDLPGHDRVRDLKEAWIAEIDGLLGAKIGTARITLDNYDSVGNRLVRSRETNSGDFAADALYYLFDNMGMTVDVAIMNGGGVRNKALTGDITYKVCKDMHTFGNVACLQTVTGQQILDALEWGSRSVGVAEVGGFLHVSGLTYQINTAIPSTARADEFGTWAGGPTGEYRVHDVMVYSRGKNCWEPLDLTKTYNLAGYNYTLRDLGDGFAMFNGAVNVLDYVMEDYMVLANYVCGFADRVVDAKNSPLLAKYPNFKLDYSAVTGSGRIAVETAYTVSFADSRGVVNIPAQTVEAGQTVTRPADPAVSGLRFEGWYTDPACTPGSVYNFAAPVTGSFTLYAKWSEVVTVDPWYRVLAFRHGTYYPVVLEAGEGGTVSSSAGEVVRYAKALTFTVTPDEGYAVDDVVINGRSVGAVTEYTVPRAKRDYTVVVTFRPLG